MQALGDLLYSLQGAKVGWNAGSGRPSLLATGGKGGLHSVKAILVEH